MIFNSKFIYDDGAGEGAGGDTSVNNNGEIKLPEDVQKELDSLRQFKSEIENKPKDPTQEELERQQELDNVNFRKYAVESKLLKDDDFNKIETFKQKADRELAFEDFSAEWDADNTEVDPEDKERLKQEAFENLYHLNSTDKTLKAKGEKLLAKEAAEKRTPYETSYKSAKEQYGKDKSIAAKIPEFNKFIDDTIKNAVPEKIVFKTKDGEDEIEVEVELTKEQRTELDKVIRTARNFNSFSEGKPEEIKATIEKKINGFIKINTFESATQKSYEKGKGVGTANGSNVGAENLFMLVKNSENKDLNKDQSSVVKQIRENHEQIRLRQQGR